MTDEPSELTEPRTTQTPYSDVDWKTHVVLQSNNNTPVEYVVLRDAATSQSTLIKEILEDDEFRTKEEKILIPVPNVNGHTLKYVIQYIEHHHKYPAKEIDKPLKKSIRESISPFDANFLFTDLVKNGIEKEHDLLIECILAANFLGINNMRELTCACLASLIRGKTPPELRELFGFADDVSEEEERKIREENRWCEDA